MDILASLNPPQRLAVEHGKGPALVLAGAGSGKTRVIAHRIAYLIQNGATRPENILAVTFTNKAADEMRERVHKLLGPNRVSEPLISTFHSFCVRLLRREIQLLGYKRDFTIYDTDDQRRLMKQILKDLHISEKDIPPREVLGRISYAKNHNVPFTAYADRFRSETAEDVARIYEAYDKRLRSCNALDFDDLLLKAAQVLEKAPRLRDYYSDWYRYILVDEYQDTNRPQYKLLRLLTAKHNNIFVVGDEDQSIYRFRGADIGNILNFEKDFPGARVIKLEQNYRSSQNILDTAGAMIGHNTERKGKVLWTENPKGDLPALHRSTSARAEAAWTALEIEEIQEQNPEYRIGILYRANYLSRNFEEALVQKGIAYAVVGSVAFFGRMEVKDMLAYLRVIYNPEDDIALLRIINTPPRGIGATTIDLLTRTALEKGVPVSEVVREFASNPGKAGRSHRALERFQKLFDGWTAGAENASPAEMIDAVMTDVEYRRMLEQHETAEEAANRMANIEELISAASEAEERGETIFEFLDRASLSSELDQLDPNARVSLMTVHSAKGLEFDVVFLAGLEEGLFPHSMSSGNREDLEEERRLCYVGMTRARQKLFLTWTPFRRNFGADAGMPSPPSRFLGEIPPGLVEGIDPAESFIEEDDDDFEVEEDLEAPAFTRREISSPRKTEKYYPKTLAELRSYVEKKQTDKAAAGPAGPGLKSGMRVRHAQFGDGIILSRERMGNDIRLTVTFSRVGRKVLIERYAKLQAL